MLIFYVIAGVIRLSIYFWPEIFNLVLQSLSRQYTEVTDLLPRTVSAFLSVYVGVSAFVMFIASLVIFSNYIGENLAKKKTDFMLLGNILIFWMSL